MKTILLQLIPFDRSDTVVENFIVIDYELSE